MVWMVREITARGSDVRLCHVSGAVQALLELVRMDKLVSLYETREEAIESFV